MTRRHLDHLIPAQETSDGAGVLIKRSLGAHGLRLDPFLMLDEFGSENASDYIAGFPAHPHRGFETVTYMLDGHMLHEDHLGNRGHLRSGDVQWMTAGRGIIHSEMPQQESGTMRGFQLWLNLPAKEKMIEPAYLDIPAAQIPRVAFDGGWARVIAGEFRSGTQIVPGAVTGRSQMPLYFDVQLDADASFEHPLAPELNAALYVYEGTARLIGASATQALPTSAAAVLGTGDCVSVRADACGARFLLLAARPIGEPVAQYGPFVMNTRAELEQAIADYQSGALASPTVHANTP